MFGGVREGTGRQGGVGEGVNGDPGGGEGGDGDGDGGGVEGISTAVNPHRGFENLKYTRKGFCFI